MALDKTISVKSIRKKLRLEEWGDFSEESILRVIRDSLGYRRNSAFGYDRSCYTELLKKIDLLRQVDAAVKAKNGKDGKGDGKTTSARKRTARAPKPKAAVQQDLPLTGGGDVVKPVVRDTEDDVENYVFGILPDDMGLRSDELLDNDDIDYSRLHESLDDKGYGTIGEKAPKRKDIFKEHRNSDDQEVPEPGDYGINVYVKDCPFLLGKEQLEDFMRVRDAVDRHTVTSVDDFIKSARMDEALRINTLRNSLRNRQDNGPLFEGVSVSDFDNKADFESVAESVIPFKVIGLEGLEGKERMRGLTEKAVFIIGEEILNLEEVLGRYGRAFCQRLCESACDIDEGAVPLLTDRGVAEAEESSDLSEGVFLALDGRTLSAEPFLVERQGGTLAMMRKGIPYLTENRIDVADTLSEGQLSAIERLYEGKSNIVCNVVTDNGMRSRCLKEVTAMGLSAFISESFGDGVETVTVADFAATLLKAGVREPVFDGKRIVLEGEDSMGRKLSLSLRTLSTLLEDECASCTCGEKSEALVLTLETGRNELKEMAVADLDGGSSRKERLWLAESLSEGMKDSAVRNDGFAEVSDKVVDTFRGFSGMLAEGIADADDPRAVLDAAMTFESFGRGSRGKKAEDAATVGFDTVIGEVRKNDGITEFYTAAIDKLLRGFAAPEAKFLEWDDMRRKDLEPGLYYSFLKVPFRRFGNTGNKRKFATFESYSLMLTKVLPLTDVSADGKWREYPWHITFVTTSSAAETHKQPLTVKTSARFQVNDYLNIEFEDGHYEEKDYRDKHGDVGVELMKDIVVSGILASVSSKVEDTVMDHKGKSRGEYSSAIISAVSSFLPDDLHTEEMLSESFGRGVMTKSGEDAAEVEFNPWTSGDLDTVRAACSNYLEGLGFENATQRQAETDSYFEFVDGHTLDVVCVRKPKGLNGLGIRAQLEVFFSDDGSYWVELRIKHLGCYMTLLKLGADFLFRSGLYKTWLHDMSAIPIVFDKVADCFNNDECVRRLTIVGTRPVSQKELAGEALRRLNGGVSESFGRGSRGKKGEDIGIDTVLDITKPSEFTHRLKGIYFGNGDVTEYGPNSDKFWRNELPEGNHVMIVDTQRHPVFGSYDRPAMIEGSTFRLIKVLDSGDHSIGIEVTLILSMKDVYEPQALEPSESELKISAGFTFFSTEMFNELPYVLKDDGFKFDWRGERSVSAVTFAEPERAQELVLSVMNLVNNGDFLERLKEIDAEGGLVQDFRKTCKAVDAFLERPRP